MQFRSPLGRSTRQKARIPNGHRVYAIGDVHGRDDLLGDLLSQIECDIEQREPAKNVVIFLGDLIDRGPSSAQVLDRLLNYRPEGITPMFLAGNHEEVLLRLLAGDDDLVSDWLRFGGAQCCESYGIDPARLSQMRSDDAGAMIRRAIPPSHREFLEGFGDTVSAGDYVFVHAGIRPGVPLFSQAQSDLRWIREPFLSDERSHGVIVVHGHTISGDIDRTPNRIGVDTGAYRSGVLTAFCAAGSDTWFLQASASADHDGTLRGNLS